MAVFNGGNGNDTFNGGGAADSISGFAGNDTLTGGGGIDTIAGGAGTDSLSGNAGNDSIRGGGGNDTVSGGNDNDLIFGDGDADQPGIWNYRVYDFDFTSADGQAGSIAGGTLRGQGTTTGFDVNALTLAARGTTGDPNDFGIIFDSTFTAGLGGTYRFTTTSDDGSRMIIRDQNGVALNFANQTGGTLAYLNNDFHQSATTRFGDVTLAAGQVYTIEILFWENAGQNTLAATVTPPGGVSTNLLSSPFIGGAQNAGNDSLLGDAGLDTIFGEAGNDSIFGGTEDDQLFGGAGADSITGGTGNDTLDGGAGNDTFTGNEGNDLFVGGDGDDQNLIGADNVSGNDTFFGGLGNDTWGAGDGNDVVHGDEGNDAIEGGNLADTLFGGDGNDYMAGFDVSNLVVNGPAGNINPPVASDDNANDVLFGGAGNDIGLGGGGNDSVSGDAGDDRLFGGIGADSLDGGADNDSLDGGDGNDTLIGAAGLDTLFGGVGNDSLDGGTEADSLSGDAGLDTLIGGDGNDTLFGGTENDSILGGTGNDSVFGDDGDDTIDGGESTDTIFGGAGNDLITDSGGAISDDTIYGGSGNDTISGGTREDSIFGDAGNDSLNGDAGNDSIFGGADNDTLAGGLDNDSLIGDAGDDSLLGNDGDDILLGEEGDDILLGGAGADRLFGGAGADVLTGGDDNDTIFGGIGDTVNGSENITDVDVLDLQAFGKATTNIIFDPLNAENGTVEFLDGNGDVIGTMAFSNIENIIPCFTPGSMILTDRGAVAVERLYPGDLVLTRDHGLQRVRWVGRRDLSTRELLVNPALRPVKIAKGALGHNLPARDMLVSPQHRMLFSGARANLLFGEAEVLVAATHLDGRPGISRIMPRGITYLHVMFDQHEIINADGAWSESFQPAVRTLNAMEDGTRAELLGLFPELSHDDTRYPAARLSLKAHEARVLLAA